MRKQPKRKKSLIMRLIVLAFAVYMVATLIGTGNELVRLRAELRENESKRDSLKLTIQEYETLLASDSHAEIIEKAARERLGFVYSDEEIYIDISGN